MEKPKKKYWQTERGKEINKRYKQSERGKAVNKKYRESEKAKALDREYHKKYNKSEKGKATKKKYEGSEKCKATARKYRESTKYKEMRKIARKRYYTKHKGIEKYIINSKVSWSIRDTLKNNKGRKHWEDLVGYKLNDLIKRLKKTIPTGYVWQDYLDGKLHLDHIIPISVFNFTKPEHIDFKKCWALDNLQLLPAIDNIVKQNRVDAPFQPSLGF